MRVHFVALIVTLSLAACSSTGTTTSRTAGARAGWWAYPPLSSVQYSPSEPGRSAAVSYPASVYPPPGNDIKALRCPSKSGLQPFDRASQAAAQAVVHGFDQRSLSADLHDSDRAFWPQVLIDHASKHGQQNAAASVFISGQLTGTYADLVAPGFASRIANGCGRRVARDSYLIVDVVFDRRALQNSVLLDRRGHVLLYFASTTIIRNGKNMRGAHQPVIYLGAPQVTVHATATMIPTLTPTTTQPGSPATTSLPAAP